MANTYVIGGKGAGNGSVASGGGGYVSGSATANYGNCQGANGDVLYFGDICTYTHATKTITKTGIGTASVVGVLVNVAGTNLTPGRYAVTSIPGANSIICADIVSTNDNTDTTVYVGGAIGNAMTPMLSLLETVDGLLASGDTLLVPNGSAGQRTYTETNNCTIGAASSGQTINIKGVANDGTAIVAVRDTPTSGLFPNGPLNEEQFPKIDFAATKYLAVGAYANIANVMITGDRDGSTGYLLTSGGGDYCTFQSCIVINAGTGLAVYTDNCGVIFDCDLNNSASDNAQYVLRCRSSKVSQCRISGNPDATSAAGLVELSNAPSDLINNVFYDLGGGSAINSPLPASGTGGLVGSNIFYNCAGCITSSNNASAYSALVITNNIAVNCTNFLVNGYAATAAQHLFVKDNVYYNVTNVITDADWYGISATAALGFTALTADPFGNAANGDFTVSNTADTRAKIIGKGSFGGDLGATTHDRDYPAVDSVVTTDTVNGEDGDYVSPATSIVKDGEFYGPDSSYKGEYAGGGGGGLLAHPGMNGGINA